jgi:hypothetical protein
MRAERTLTVSQVFHHLALMWSLVLTKKYRNITNSGCHNIADLARGFGMNYSPPTYKVNKINQCDYV